MVFSSLLLNIASYDRRIHRGIFLPVITSRSPSVLAEVLDVVDAIRNLKSVEAVGLFKNICLSKEIYLKCKVDFEERPCKLLTRHWYGFDGEANY